MTSIRRFFILWLAVAALCGFSCYGHADEPQICPEMPVSSNLKYSEEINQLLFSTKTGAVWRMIVMLDYCDRADVISLLEEQEGTFDDSLAKAFQRLAGDDEVSFEVSFDDFKDNLIYVKNLHDMAFRLGVSSAFSDDKQKIANWCDGVAFIASEMIQ